MSRFATAMGLVGMVTFACPVFSVGQGAERRRTGCRQQVPSRGHAPEFREEEKVQKGTLNNIKNLYEAMGAERVNVELVAHGAGLSLFTKQDTKLAAELARLKTSYGVSYTACSNTMKAQGLTWADLIDQVDRTMPAMVRLMELQEQGWAYIKP